MTTITREQAQAVSDLKAGYTLGHADVAILKELARIALASLEAEPAIYAAEETLAYANMGELHLTCLSEPMGDAVIPLYTATPAPVVPPEKNDSDYVTDCHGVPSLEDCAHQRGWNECRAAMLQGSQPVTTDYKLPEGWVAVPVEPTQAMMNAWLSEVANWRGHAAGYRAMLAAAPQQEVK